MEIEELINKMLEVKEKYPSRSIDEILRLFNIQALQNLTKTIWRSTHGR